MGAWSYFSVPFSGMGGTQGTLTRTTRVPSLERILGPYPTLDADCAPLEPRLCKTTLRPATPLRLPVTNMRLDVSPLPGPRVPSGCPETVTP